LAKNRPVFSSEGTLHNDKRCHCLSRHPKWAKDQDEQSDFLSVATLLGTVRKELIDGTENTTE
jgi:hypothetical protein